MLDYTLTPVALTVLISLILVSVACLALMALAVKRTMWDNKSKQGATDIDNNAKRRRHRHKGSSGASAVIYDISDGSRRSGVGSDRASGIGASGTSGMSCLVGVLVAASFIGIAVGMAFAIDRTVVALC
jgi:Flp pilus assembly protein TadB